MKYKRIRIKIKKYLELNGPKSTTQIYTYINDIDSNGITMAALNNVLSKDPMIRKTHKEKVVGLTQHVSYISMDCKMMRLRYCTICTVYRIGF